MKFISNDINPPVVGSSKNIDWSDINYPPCYKIVHFKMNELKGSVKGFVLKLYLGVVIIAAVIVINSNSLKTLVLSTIIKVAKDFTAGINLFYSFLSNLSLHLDIFSLLVPTGAVAYGGYLAACFKASLSDLVMRFRIYQVILCVFWLVFSITSAGCFDGWTRISGLKSYHSGVANFCIFLAVMQSLGFTASCILGIICVFQISKVLKPITLDC